MKCAYRRRFFFAGLAIGVVAPGGLPAADTVATAVYARVAKHYERERHKDGTFKPEFYALANGGRLDGTVSDNTVDRVAYAEVAQIVQSLLTSQNYHYARKKDQAQLLLVLNWGNTVTYNRANYEEAIKRGGTEAENQMRDLINEHNARVLGYVDELAGSNDIRRWAGGGEHHADLLGDIESPRYYIMISAFHFRDLADHGQRRLLWQVRVSVQTAGSSFGESILPMLKSAAKYAGQDSGKLVRVHESKGSVELGNLKFLGEAEAQPEPAVEEKQ